MVKKFALICDICGETQINDREDDNRASWEKFLPAKISLGEPDSKAIDRLEKDFAHLCQSCYKRLRIAIQRVIIPRAAEKPAVEEIKDGRQETEN